MSARDWTPADWLAAPATALASDRPAPRAGRIRYRTARGAPLRAARMFDQEPPR